MRKGRALAQGVAVAVAAALLGLPGLATAAVAPAGLSGGHVRISPDVPIVGAKEILEVSLPGGEVPGRVTAQLISPSGQPFPVTLVRVGRSLLRGTTRFADDGLWTLRVRATGIDASGDVLVLQNGALVPGPKVGVAAAGAAGGGLGVVGGR